MKKQKEKKNLKINDNECIISPEIEDEEEEEEACGKKWGCVLEVW
jgi:hypothetical protein